MEIKVTRINGEFHARLFEGERLLDEMSCKNKSDIGWICREMLRWQDKLGNSNSWTTKARERQNETPKMPDGVKYLGKEIYEAYRA